jgi:hypothetical protein
MTRGLFMVPMHGMRMMHSFLAIARLMVFGCFLVLLRSLGGHGLSSRER